MPSTEYRVLVDYDDALPPSRIPVLDGYGLPYGDRTRAETIRAQFLGPRTGARGAPTRVTIQKREVPDFEDD